MRRGGGRVGMGVPLVEGGGPFLGSVDGPMGRIERVKGRALKVPDRNGDLKDKVSFQCPGGDGASGRW